MKSRTRTAAAYAVGIIIFSACMSSCIGFDRSRSSVLRLSAGTELRTRVSGGRDEDESRLNDIAFHVFNESGALEATAVWKKGEGASCEVSNGRKRIYAVVNCGPVEPPLSENDLLSSVSYIYDNRPDNLIMVGNSEEEVDGDKAIRITVRRFAGKVEIDEIKVSLEDDARTGITINSIYLTNVNSSITFDGRTTASPDDWVNRAGYAASKADTLTYETSGAFIPDGCSHAARHTFYAYPNRTPTDSHLTDSFCARYTRLVIDTDAGFYRLDIPGLSSNNYYIFKTVTITGAGSSDPETDEACNCTAEISVEDWEDGESRTEYL